LAADFVWPKANFVEPKAKRRAPKENKYPTGQAAAKREATKSLKNPDWRCVSVQNQRFENKFD